jgi:hypothetical protein
MARKAEEMTAVVEELMDIHARDERCGALLGADEVDCKQEKKAAEDGPRQKFSDRNRTDIGGKNDIGHDKELPETRSDYRRDNATVNRTAPDYTRRDWFA